MPLRTPRRRISSRTKQRYYDIKHFFRKALGSSIHTDNKTTSTATNNFNDCEHDISFDIDEEYNDNNDCCDCGHDVQSLEEYFPTIEEEENYPHIHDIITEQKEEENRETANSETKYWEQIPEPECKFDREVQAAIEIEQNSSQSSIELQEKDHDNKQRDFSMVTPKLKPEFSNDHHHRSHRKKTKITGRHVSINDSSHRKRREELMSSQSESAYYHNVAPKIVPLRTGFSYDAYNKIDRNRKFSNPYQHQALAEKRKQYQVLPEECKQKKKTKRHKSESPLRFEEERKRHRKPKLENLKLDHDFIADIIRKQYKPTPIFERRRSDMSQFSAPVCRDRDLSGAEPTGVNLDGYSCYYENYNPRNNRYVTNYHDVDLRSFSDTRHYNRKSRSRSRRRHNDIYNDSTMYDIIPVKEKSSPKLHRRHGDYEPRPHTTHHKEVPPSPRTRRPRLNLQSQYDKYNDIYMSTSSHTNLTNPQRTWKSREQIIPETETDICSELYERQQRCRNDMRTHPKIYQDEVVATSNTLVHDGETKCNLSKTLEISSKANNTDKALNEIKDILQNFLHEIKKESPDVSFKSDDAPKILQESMARTADNSILPANCHKIHCNAAQCTMASPYLPPIGSSCYPVLPVCPMNCVQSGYIVPHPSFTCLTCKKSTQVQKTSTDAAESSNNKSKETEELVKEIYKFITLNPTLAQKESPGRKDVELTSRGVGSNYRPLRRDAKVGTPKVKYQSRSCEAIGSRSFLEPYSPPHASYSDTIIEKLSVQPVEESEVSTNGLIMDPRKTPYNKFSKVLKSMKIRRNKSPMKDSSAGTTDTSEMTESTPTGYREAKRPPPFRQDVQAYNMHGIDYDPHLPPPHLHPHHRYPSPPYHTPHYSPPDSYHPQHGYGDVHNYDTRKPFHSPPVSEIYHHTLHQHPIYETEPQVPPAPHYPSYDPHYNMHPPQIPLCLKEIEVKSISTQSEKKLSFFKRLTKKPQAPVILTARSGDAPQRNFSTQTSQEKPPRKFQYWGAKKKYRNDKLLDFGSNVNPLTYGYEQHKKLAHGDIKMRDALLVKMFRKRNPFSPNNLLLKTILGKDKAGYGEPNNFFKSKFLF